MIVGVLGAGQLGRMLALAGYPLGLRFRFLDPAPDAPAGHLAPMITEPYGDLDVLERFAQGLDAITYEFENVPVETARLLQRYAPVFPPPAALETAQDRLVEKSCFRDLGVPTPRFAPVESRTDLASAVAEVGLPAVLKTRRFGYDGKGQEVLRTEEDVNAAWESLGGSALILEGFVPFERELSLIAVRGRDGATAFYPLVENTHREGILRLSRAPAPGGSATLQQQAEEYAGRVLAALDYIGVLAIELFLVEGRLLANEMAPRVHNSGHWTIEGAETSQFENHLRAILGLPLGSPAPVGCSAMWNLIGDTPPPETILALPDAHLHLYGKEAQPGRKLGHITLRAQEGHTLVERLGRLGAVLASTPGSRAWLHLIGASAE